MNRREFFKLTAGVAISWQMLPAGAVIHPKKRLKDWFLRWLAGFREFIGDCPPLRRSVWPIIDEIMAREGRPAVLTDLIYGNNPQP